MNAKFAFRCSILIMASSALRAGSSPPVMQLKAIAKDVLNNATSASAVRGATPRLTDLKHGLRDWVEAHLANYGENIPGEELRGLLNAELDDAGLQEQPDIDEFNAIDPYANVESILHPDGVGNFLAITTGVGIQCGDDESAYLYEWTGTWTRRLSVEQNTYTEKEYTPQTGVKLHLSTADPEGKRTLLISGINPGCASFWQTSYNRVYRASPSKEPVKVLDLSRIIYIEDHPPMQLRTEPGSITIQFPVRSIDTSYPRTFVAHYALAGDKAVRVDPIALRPNDFVEEWMSLSWEDAAKWSESVHAGSLKSWHSKFLPTENVTGDPEPWRKCGDGLYQIGYSGLKRMESEPVEKTTPIGSAYFLVRDLGQYRFRMVNMSDKEFDGCGPEYQPDDKAPTLIPAPQSHN